MITKATQTLKDFKIDKIASAADASEKTILQSEMATKKSTSIFTSFMDMLPNPEPILSTNSLKYDIYDEILNDSFVQGLVNARLGSVLAQEWELIRNDANSAEMKFLNYHLSKLFDSDLWQDILMTPQFGIQFLEVVWEADRFWSAGKIVAKPHEVFSFTSDGQLRLLVKENTLTGIEVPEMKFLLPVNANKRPTFVNYYGSSILAKGYWNTFIRKHEIDFWSVFSEDFGMPKFRGEIKLDMLDRLRNDLGMTTTQMLTHVKDQLRLLRQNGILAHLEGLNVTEFGGDKSVPKDIFSGLINETKKLDSVLYLGHDGAAMSTPGELGGKPQAVKAMDWIVSNDKDILVKTINQYLAWFHYLNFNSAEAPQIRLFEKDDEAKYNLRADIDLKLKQMGVEFNADYVSDNYNLDKKYFTLGEPVEPAPTKSKIDNALLRLHEVHPEISNADAMEYIQMIYDDEEHEIQ